MMEPLSTLVRRSFAMLAVVIAAIVVTQSPLAIAASDTVDAIVVKYRDDALPANVTELPYADQLELAKALQSGFAGMGRTRDGAFRFALNPPLSLSDTRSALNRVRDNRAILYANIDPASVRDRSPLANLKADATLSVPTNRLVVKYRDVTRVTTAMAGLPLDRAELDRISAIGGQTVSYVRTMHDGAQVLAMMRRLPVAQVEAIAAQLSLLPDVEFAQPDYIDHIAVATNDPCFPANAVAACNGGSQWDLYDPVGGVNILPAWAITKGSSSIRVSVIDTGALFTHPDLNGRFITGFDMIDDALGANDSDPSPMCSEFTFSGCFGSRDANAADPGDWLTSAQTGDPSNWFFNCGTANSSFHGSHVAGTIGASADNNIGIAGINWVSKILPVRVLGRCGGYGSDIADGIAWASGVPLVTSPNPAHSPGTNATPARVLNLSLGGRRSDQSCDPLYQSAINAALANGTVVAIAAGNSNEASSFHTPGNCNGVITVGATGKTGYKAYYSNYGPQVEITAPGGDTRFNATYNPDARGILSTLNASTTSPGATFNYVEYQGTSMATPHIAGIASLMLSANPALTPAQVLSKMQSTARAFPGGGPVCNTTVPRPSSGSWFACQCTTALCGSGIVDAGAAVAASAPPVTTRKLRDFDANGKSDLLWRNNTTGDHLLWLMNAGTAIDSNTFLPDLNWQVTHTAFFDSDSYADILWRNSATGAVVMWLMNGKSAATGVQLLADLNWKVVQVGDFNGDGKSDLLWRNSVTGEVVMWLMDGYYFIGGGTVLTDLAWQVTQVGDFNGDGKTDLLWRNDTTGATVMWLMNGTTKLSTATLLTSVPWTVTHVGDLNGDGKSDLVWRNSVTGETAAWVMNGTALTVGNGLLSDPLWTVQKLADLDGDGRADIIWRNSGTGEIVAWLMNGSALASGAQLLPPGAWTFVTSGDYNGDGKADLIIKNTATNQVVMWLMNGVAPTAGYSLTSDPHYSVTP